jgi:hypothetical protein
MGVLSELIGPNRFDRTDDVRYIDAGDRKVGSFHHRLRGNNCDRASVSAWAPDGSVMNLPRIAYRFLRTALHCPLGASLSDR